MADKRQKLRSHFVVRTVVERVDHTGVIPYNGTTDEATNVAQTVTELGAFTMTASSLGKVVETTQTMLELVVDRP